MPPKDGVRPGRQSITGASPGVGVGGMGGRSDKNKDAKPRKLNAQQVALNKAVDMADRMYKQHERERVKREAADQVARQDASLDAALEKARLSNDKAEHEKVVKEMEEREQLAYRECEKHRRWSRIPEASRLPQVDSESSINTFLSVWREREEEYDKYSPPVTVLAKRGSIGGVTSMFRFVNGELGVSPADRKKMVESELRRCLEAYELTEAIHLEADRSLTQRKLKDLAFFSTNIGRVCEQVLQSLDFITIHALLGYDVMLEGPDSEFLTMSVPPANPVVKYGLWVKVKETTRSFAAMAFPNIAMRLDPKSSALPKLPKALGLSKENVAVRIIQLGFNPHGHHGSVGREYYALNCVIKIDLLNFTERPNKSGDWLYRSETEEAHVLHVVPYPPQVVENVEEDLSLRVSFEAPNSIVMRHASLLIGRWLEASKDWEPCSHTNPSTDTSGTEARRCVFATSEFSTFAVLQEKGFDVPYEHWRLHPMSFDQVLMVLEGRRRGEGGDREFRILVQDAQCKLLAPEDPELAYLRENWLEPATLLRLLSQTGFNFLLEDEDAKFIESIVPKSSALEEKVYADIAQFCLFYAIASSRHNRYGEDADLALFRVSKQSRALDQDARLEVHLDDDSDWHSVRYQTQRCAFAALEESADEPDLHILEGHASHFNLYTLLLHEKGEEVRLQVVHHTNFLLRRCVFQLLCLIRPLTWG
ncbi:putative chaperone protein DNAj [Trypanosoma conorhini]|uniref:Putative chaperone protein DNAj n=1 Tax=Trypanosoma conorhini TaxID=83891 RepID=A0A3R7P171_9TRYP|nr:putative chaperone protein DNAj [Trypanosoma conorhini]RNF27210.1 putative chaperone protein DNAj [Trypanosoma conorhini]